MNTNKKRKLRTGIMAALLMMLILLTGTYAWTQFNNVGFNAVYTETNFGGRFHNHFVWENGSDGIGEGTHNKDLFAENFGENRVFVRARLREFMMNGGVPVIAGTTIDNPRGTGVDGVEWPIYVSALDNPHIRQVGSATETIGRNGIEWNLGHHTNKVFMPTFNHAQYRVEADDIDASVPPLFARENAYEMIEAIGMATDGHTFDITTQAEARDILDSGNQTGPGLMGHAESDITNSLDEHGEHDYWEEDELMSSPRLIVDEEGVLRAINDPDTDEPFVHTAKYTLSPENPIREGVTLAHPVTNGVMTMQQWRQLERPRGDFWVLDTDGWFYWASPLRVGEATSLLLDEIIVEDRRGEGIEYIVNVEAQFTNWSNIEVAPQLADMSDDAIELWMAQNIDIPETAHETFQDPETGTLWRVLLPDDGDGNALIITEYVHGLGTPFRNDGINGFRTFEGSHLQDIMNEWFGNPNFVGRSLRSIALNYEFQDESGNTVYRQTISSGIDSVVEGGQIISVGIEVDFVGGTVAGTAPWVTNGNTATQWGMNMTRGMTRPQTNGAPGNGELFPLSVTEVYTYFAGANPTPLSNGSAHEIQEGVARHTQTVANAGSEAGGTGQWLRSPGSGAAGPVRLVGGSGNIIGSLVDNPVVGFRPALWIRR